ncbi:hypothetical protein BHM03_00031457 [Ensete ventricosum]|nr:hypothetical protein BHM03_00031457 [Ensete ventricosum]
MEERNDLKNQIEELIHKGYLKRNVKRPRESSLCHYHPIEKPNDVIYSGSASDEDSALDQKAYARTIVVKCPRQKDELEISFEAGKIEYPDHDDTLLVSVHNRVKRVMIDTGSLADICILTLSINSG